MNLLFFFKNVPFFRLIRLYRQQTIVKQQYSFLRKVKRILYHLCRTVTRSLQRINPAIFRTNTNNARKVQIDAQHLFHSLSCLHAQLFKFLYSCVFHGASDQIKFTCFSFNTKNAQTFPRDFLRNIDYREFKCVIFFLWQFFKAKNISCLN